MCIYMEISTQRDWLKAQSNDDTQVEATTRFYWPVQQRSVLNLVEIYIYLYI